jgi:hypothetical protein
MGRWQSGGALAVRPLCSVLLQPLYFMLDFLKLKILYVSLTNENTRKRRVSDYEYQISVLDHPGPNKKNITSFQMRFSSNFSRLNIFDVDNNRSNDTEFCIEAAETPILGLANKEEKRCLENIEGNIIHILYY